MARFTYNEQLKNWLVQPKIRQRIAALRVTETVTYTAVWACKRDALHMAFNAFEQDTCEAATNERAAFEAFVLGKAKLCRASVCLRLWTSITAVPDKWVGSHGRLNFINLMAKP